MELKNKKYINNTKSLPGFHEGSDLYKMLMQSRNGNTSLWADPSVYKDDPYANNPNPLIPGEQKDPYIPQEKKLNLEGAPSVVKFGADLYNSFQPAYDKNDVLNNTITGTSYRYGVPYQTKTIDTNMLDKNVGLRSWNKVLQTGISGYNAGSGFGGNLFKAKNGKLPKFSLGQGLGIGLGVAGLIGGTIGQEVARRRELDAQDEARAIAQRENAYNRSIAGTQGIQQMYSDYNLLPHQQMLRFSCGKMPKFNDGKRVRSPFGLIYANQNAWGDGGEILRQWSPDGDIIAESRLPKHKSGTDTYPLHIDNLTEIIPARIANKMDGYKNGKLPKFNPGRKIDVSGTDNTITTLTGIGAGIDQLVKSYEPVNRYNFTTQNQMLAPSMRQLNSLSVSPYPIMRDMSKMYAKTKYGINNSGLAGGLKDMQNMYVQNALYSNLYDMLSKNQIQNNAYISDAAKTAISAGEHQASRNQQAVIAAKQLSDAAIANQSKMRQGAWYNMLSAMQQGYKNKEKMDMFKLMYGLYSDDLDIKRDELKNRRIV